MKPTDRILAVEIRADRAGFAVLEASKGLLDYGTTWFNSRKVAGHRLNQFLWRRQASTLIMRSPSPRHRSKRTKSLERMTMIEAQKLRLRIVCIPDRMFRSYWAHH